MEEWINVAEFSRRMGVHTENIYKGIREGRIKPERSGKNGTMQLPWPKAKDDWINGSRGKMSDAEIERRKNKGLPDISKKSDAKPEPVEVGDAMSLMEIQKKRELVKLKLDQVKLDEAEGKLVDAETTKREGYKLAKTIISGLYTIADRVSDEIAGMSDPNDIHALIVSEIDMVIQEFREKYAK